VPLLTRRLEFSSSHRLAGEPFAHGHNYALEVTIQGRIDDETGMVMDLKDLSELMDAEVAGRFDHRDLNDDTGYFDERPPTAENFATLIFDLLDRALPEGALHSVCLAPVPELAVEVSR
jgi:6-pyruvoyltetrahydropterin/6-carboxytetrahydropterin synthase